MSDDKRQEEILERVYARGRQLRMRRRVSHVLSSALVLSLAGGGMVFALTAAPNQAKKESVPADEPDPVVETTKPKPSSTAKPKPASSIKPKPVVKESSKPTTEPAPECFNSTNPDCGTFFWASKPYNSQLDIDVSGPASLQTGEQGTWAIRVADADAKIMRGQWKIYWGDGTYHTPWGPAGDTSGTECVKGYGKWSLPPKYSDVYELSATHTFSAPGTYTLKFKFRSRDNRTIDGKYLCQQAYGEDRSVMMTVTVSDPEPPASPPPSP